MKKCLMVIIAISPILLSSCKGSGNLGVNEIKRGTGDFPLKIVKEKEIKIDLVFAGVGALTRLDRPELYLEFIKDKDLDIWQYNAELELEKKYLIRYGQGPGECLNPSIMGGDIDNILIRDSVALKYYLFDGNFNIKKTFTAPFFNAYLPQARGFSPGKNRILDGFASFLNMYENEIKVNIGQITGDKVTSKNIYNMKLTLRTRKDKLFISGIPLHSLLIDDHIFILRTDEYRLLKMDLDGNPVKQARVVDVAKKSFSEEQRKTWIKETRQGPPNRLTFPEHLWPACWMLPIKDGIAIGLRDDYEPVKPAWIEADYFDLELNYRGKIKLPGFLGWNDPFYGQRDIDFFFNIKGDKLYFLDTRETENGEYYWLTRWRIEIGHI